MRSLCHSNVHAVCNLMSRHSCWVFVKLMMQWQLLVAAVEGGLRVDDVNTDCKLLTSKLQSSVTSSTTETRRTPFLLRHASQSREDWMYHTEPNAIVVISLCFNMLDRNWLNPDAFARWLRYFTIVSLMRSADEWRRGCCMFFFNF